MAPPHHPTSYCEYHVIIANPDLPPDCIHLQFRNVLPLDPANFYACGQGTEKKILSQLRAMGDKRIRSVAVIGAGAAGM
jgi:hypothetical protein